MAASFPPRISSDTQLSKSLSWLLRHGAVKEGIRIRDDGFVSVDEILTHRNFAGIHTLADVERVVKNNDKQRFSLIKDSTTNKFFIKANQGHSLPSVKDTHLTPISKSDDYAAVIHGTYLKCWPRIKKIGLSRMRRNHVHFATGTLDSASRVTSGMRKDCELYIYVNLAKALEDGLSFYVSDNGVVLSPGNERGIVETKYFSKVVSVRDEMEENTTNANMRNESANVQNATQNNHRCEVCDVPIQISQLAFHERGKKHRQNLQVADVVSRQVNIYTYIDNYNSAGLKTYLESQCGPIETLKSVNNGKTIHVRFKDAASANRAVSLRLKFANRFLKIKPCVATKKLFKNATRNTEALPSPEVFKPKGSNFEGQVRMLIAKIEKSDFELENMNILCADLQEILKFNFPGCEVIPFGSSVTGLSFSKSDLDCFVYIRPDQMDYIRSIEENEERLHEKIINNTKKLLCKHRNKFSAIFAIPLASIPIVKFLYLPTNNHCDLSFKGGFGVYNSHLIRDLVKTDPRIRDLIMIIKYWAKSNDFIGVGCFSSYALCMLVIYRLQTLPQPLLPSIEFLQQNDVFNIYLEGWNCGYDRNALEHFKTENNLSVLNLLLEFFKFYASFDFEKFVISVYCAEAIPVDRFKDASTFPPAFSLYANLVKNENARLIRVKLNSIYVQDPFEHSRNVTSLVGIRKVEHFRICCQYLANFIENNAREYIDECLLDNLSKTNVSFPKRKRKGDNIFVAAREMVSKFHTDQDSVVSEIRALVKSISIGILRSTFQLNSVPIDANAGSEKNVWCESYTFGMFYELWKKRKLENQSGTNSPIDQEICNSDLQVRNHALTRTPEEIFLAVFNISLVKAGIQFKFDMIKGNPSDFGSFKSVFEPIILKCLKYFVQTMSQSNENEGSAHKAMNTEEKILDIEPQPTNSIKPFVVPSSTFIEKFKLNRNSVVREIQKLVDKILNDVLCATYEVIDIKENNTEEILWCETYRFQTFHLVWENREKNNGGGFPSEPPLEREMSITKDILTPEFQKSKEFIFSADFKAFLVPTGFRVEINFVDGRIERFNRFHENFASTLLDIFHSFVGSSSESMDARQPSVATIDVAESKGAKATHEAFPSGSKKSRVESDERVHPQSNANAKATNEDRRKRNHGFALPSPRLAELFRENRDALVGELRACVAEILHDVLHSTSVEAVACCAAPDDEGELWREACRFRMHHRLWERRGQFAKAKLRGGWKGGRPGADLTMKWESLVTDEMLYSGACPRGDGDALVAADLVVRLTRSGLKVEFAHVDGRRDEFSHFLSVFDCRILKIVREFVKGKEGR